MCASYARGFTTCVFAYANTNKIGGMALASLAQLAEHALRKRMVMGSIPIGGLHLRHGRSVANMTRPGLEPGISGSGGRRLIH